MCAVMKFSHLKMKTSTWVTIIVVVIILVVIGLSYFIFERPSLQCSAFKPCPDGSVCNDGRCVPAALDQPEISINLTDEERRVIESTGISADEFIEELTIASMRSNGNLAQSINGVAPLNTPLMTQLRRQR